MATDLGPVEVECDAPSYGVVRACRAAGIHSPLDVRWCHVDHCPQSTRRNLLTLLVQAFLHGGRADERTATCSCGASMPRLYKYAFATPPDIAEEYLLGQCPRCRTVFWKPV